MPQSFPREVDRIAYFELGGLENSVRVPACCLIEDRTGKTSEGSRPPNLVVPNCAFNSAIKTGNFVPRSGFPLIFCDLCVQIDALFGLLQSDSRMEKAGNEAEEQ